MVAQASAAAHLLPSRQSSPLTNAATTFPPRNILQSPRLPTNAALWSLPPARHPLHAASPALSLTLRTFDPVPVTDQLPLVATEPPRQCDNPPLPARTIL